MPYENILLEPGPVASLILNRPQVRNALNAAHMREIIAGLRELEADSTVRVIVVKGAGRGFCAGADISEFLGKKTFVARENLHGVGDVIETIARVGKPVIAQVHGFALAGGCGLAVACDLTYAAENTVFGCPEINIGLWPHTVAAPIFRAMGRKKGLEMMFSGDQIEGKEAERSGLITRAVPADQLEAAVSAVANKLATKSPVALKIGKESFYNMCEMGYFTALRYLPDMLLLQTLTDDGQEGARAYLEKRPAEWRGT